MDWCTLLCLQRSGAVIYGENIHLFIRPICHMKPSTLAKYHRALKGDAIFFKAAAQHQDSWGVFGAVRKKSENIKL